MIKVKDDFDLDKLVGFKKDGCCYCFDENLGDLELSIVIDPNRSVSIMGYVGVGKETPTGADCNSIPSTLYNLFKMGIIEEVQDVKN